MDVPSFFGMLGVFVIAICYFLVQSQRMSANTLIYPFANLIGSALVLVSLLYDWNTPSVCIEVVWMVISLFGVIKHFRQRIEVIQSVA